MDSINILCATDNDYVPYCGIMLTSLFENNKEAKIHVYLMTETISDSNWARLQELTRKYSQNISPIIIDSRKLKDCPMHDDDYVSLATYYRLLAPQLLPQEIDKILYLDCDMIIDQSIESLYNTDIENYALAAALDEDYMNEGKYQRLEYTFEKKYFNAGVLLINLKYWRENNVTKRCFQYILGNPNKIILHDQDTLNAVLNKEVKLLSVKYNLQTAMLCRNTSLNTDTKLEIEKYKYQPTIIHYTGASKPWQKGSLHPYTKRFLRYKQLSLWSGHPLTKVNRTFLELMLHIRNSIIWFIGLKKRPKTYIIEAQD